MSFFAYLFRNRSSNVSVRTQKATELQSQVNNLNGTVSNLQEKINTISATINTEISAQTTTSNSSTQKEVSTNTSTNSNSDDIRDEIYATIKATKDGKTVTKEFEMDAAIAKTEVVDVLKCGKVVLVAETGGEYYAFKVFRLSQDYTNGKTKDIVEAGTVQYLF